MMSGAADARDSKGAWHTINGMRAMMQNVMEWSPGKKDRF
jgi:hypothetical protein